MTTLATDRYVVGEAEIIVLPLGGGADESARLFGASGVAALSVGSGKPLTLLAGSYAVNNDATAAAVRINMQDGAVFVVASGKTLDVSAADVRPDSSTWYSGSGSVTVPTTGDTFPGKVVAGGGFYSPSLSDGVTIGQGTQALLTIDHYPMVPTICTIEPSAACTGGFGFICSVGNLVFIASAGIATIDTPSYYIRDATGVQVWSFSNNGTGASTLGFGTGVTSVTFSQDILAGHGANNGGAWTFTGQPGQAQTGGANNNNGSDITWSTGLAGTGGSGSAGAVGAFTIKAGATTRVKADKNGVGFNGATPTIPAITGALSTVADAAAKAVLTSIIAALKSTAGVGIATDGTT